MTWKELLQEEKEVSAEPDAPLVGSTLTGEQMALPWPANDSPPNAAPCLTAWTRDRVYFTHRYSDDEREVLSVARHPNKERGEVLV